MLELPAELVSILRRLRFRPPAGRGRTLMDELCVVAQSPAATPGERASARLFAIGAVIGAALGAAASSVHEASVFASSRSRGRPRWVRNVEVGAFGAQAYMRLLLLLWSPEALCGPMLTPVAAY